MFAARAISPESSFKESFVIKDIHQFKRPARQLLLAAAIAATTLAQSALAAPSVERTVKAGQGIYEIVFNPADQLVYVASTGEFVIKENNEFEHRNPAIVALDAQTLDVKKTLDTSGSVPFGLGINTKTQKLYATDNMGANVAVFDVTSGKRVAVVKNGDSKVTLRQVAVDEGSNTIYVGGMGGYAKGKETPPKSEIWVIDGATNKLKTVISDPLKSVTGLALDAAGGVLYASDLQTNDIAVIDLKTHKILRTFTSGGGKVPRFGQPETDKLESDTINLALNGDGTRLFAINQASGTVTVLDPADGKVLHTIKTGHGALSARYNTKTDQLYVANRGDGSVTVIDGKTYFVIAHLPSGSHPQTVAFDPASGAVFVSNKTKGKGWGAAKEAPEPFEPGGDTVTLIRP